MAEFKTLSDTQKRYLKSHQKIPFIEVYIYPIDDLGVPTETLHGRLIDDDYSSDSQSDVRRMYNTRVRLDDAYRDIMIKDKSYFFNHKIKVVFKIGDIEINAGTYLPDSFDYSYSATTGELSLSCKDMMCKLTGERGGVMPGSGTIIPATEATYLYGSNNEIAAIKYSDNGSLYRVITETLDDAGISDYEITNPDTEFTERTEKCICWGTESTGFVFYTSLPVHLDDEHPIRLYKITGSAETPINNVEWNLTGFPYQRLEVVSLPSGTTLQNGDIYQLKYYSHTYERYIPYDLEFSAGSTFYDLLSQLRDLNEGWEMYFDDEKFKMHPIRSYLEDEIAISNDDFKEYVISENNANNMTQVYNVTEVWGSVNTAPVIANSVSFSKSDRENENTENRYTIGTYIIDHPVIGKKDYLNYFATPVGTKCAFTACASNAGCTFTEIHLKEASGWESSIRLYHTDGTPVTEGEVVAGETYTLNFQYIYSRNGVGGKGGFAKAWVLEGTYDVGYITKLVSSEQAIKIDKESYYKELSDLNSLVQENRTSGNYRGFVPAGQTGSVVQGIADAFTTIEGTGAKTLYTYNNKTSLFKILTFNDSIERISFDTPNDGHNIILLGSYETTTSTGDGTEHTRTFIGYNPTKGVIQSITENIVDISDYYPQGASTGSNIATGLDCMSDVSHIEVEKLYGCHKIVLSNDDGKSITTYIYGKGYGVTDSLLGLVCYPEAIGERANNFKAYFYNEPTRNIQYVISPDSPFTIDKIGEVRQVLSDGEYANITTSKGCADRSKLENWKASELRNTLTLEMIDIPWLDVNQKVQYFPVSMNDNKKYTDDNIYMILSKKGSFSKGTTTLELIKFQSMYDWYTK